MGRRREESRPEVGKLRSPWCSAWRQSTKEIAIRGTTENRYVIGYIAEQDHPGIKWTKEYLKQLVYDRIKVDEAILKARAARILGYTLMCEGENEYDETSRVLSRTERRILDELKGAEMLRMELPAVYKEIITIGENRWADPIWQEGLYGEEWGDVGPEPSGLKGKDDEGSRSSVVLILLT